MKKNRTKWWHLLVFLPIVIFLPVINYIVDPGEVFHSSSRSMATYWLQGNDVAFTNDNGDIRQFKKYVITGIDTEHLGCIIAGPSLSMMIQAKTVGEDDVLNISVNHASFYDTVGELGLLETLGIRYDRLILCLDSEFFTYGEAEKGSHHPAFMPYADYLLERLDGADPPVPALTEEQEAQISWQTKLATAFSVSYFQSSMDVIRTKDEWWAGMLHDDEYLIVDRNTRTSTYYRYPDCSFAFGQEATAAELAESIRSYEIPDTYQEHIDAYNVEYLDKLIDWLLKKGINVQLWICPLPPSLWDRFDSGKYPIAAEIEDCMYTLGEKYPEIKVMGSYDPYRYGITDADFYDYRHMRVESIEKYFDLTWP